MGDIAMIKWVLVDYGETISTRLPDDTVDELARLAGQDPAEFVRRYWLGRPDYDLGQPVTDYWSHVLGGEPDDVAQVVERLTRLDVHGWMHLNSLTLRNLLVHAGRSGSRLALLSNAPEPIAAAIDECRWSRHFTHRFYSCRLHYAKPDPEAFAAALEHLGADAEEVLFIDDRAANTRTAADLGMSTITFTSASALGRELRLASVPAGRPS